MILLMGFYYPSKNDDYKIPPTTSKLPPLLTSRGFALLDVNYHGSTGYGRKFRHNLKENWEIYGVQDCIVDDEYLV
ncbi:unnamed protein product [Rotaria sp. Silwood2]|nr:unnamed protein product [Rotaria sp. Silwood2]CAF3228497.1 unnamed protein product [Rotaria sp. Silwood2]CAF3445765.1 unnamed protein product [Rotaria sp. Silwood2]CAF3563459.1 unnamed protein product [Rotaria sp. Silwood2]CAF4396256.1 unnamed protein product [Rotaria sp. Silwood2]